MSAPGGGRGGAAAAPAAKRQRTMPLAGVCLFVPVKALPAGSAVFAAWKRSLPALGAAVTQDGGASITHAVVPAAGNGAANWGCLPPRLAPPGPPGLHYVTQHWWVLCCRGGCVEFVITCKWVLHPQTGLGVAAFASVSNLTLSPVCRVADCIRRQQRQDESAYRPAAAQAPAPPPPKPPAGAAGGNGVTASRAGGMQTGEEGEALPAVEAIKAWLGPLWRPECAEMDLAELALQVGRLCVTNKVTEGGG